MDTCIYMAESLHCSPETVIILLIGCTPIKNKKVFKKENVKSLYLYEFLEISLLGFCVCFDLFSL